MILIDSVLFAFCLTLEEELGVIIYLRYGVGGSLRNTAMTANQTCSKLKPWLVTTSAADQHSEAVTSLWRVAKAQPIIRLARVINQSLFCVFATLATLLLATSLTSFLE